MKNCLKLTLLLLSTNAMALNLQGYRFSDSYRYSVLDDSLNEKFPGKYVVTASVGYVSNPLYLSDEEGSERFENIISYNQIATVGYSHYVNNTLSVGIDANYIINKVAGESFSGLGDTVAKARWNFYKKDDVSVSLNPQIFLPTGNKDAFTTTDSLGGSLSAVSEYSKEKWHFLASLGYFSAGGNKYEVIDYRNLMMSQLGVSYDINEKWNGNFEAVNSYSTTGDTAQNEGDYYITFKNKVKNTLSAHFGGGIAGLDEVNRDNITLFAGVKFHEAE